MFYSNELQQPSHLLVANSAVGNVLVVVFSSGAILTGFLHGEIYYLQQPVVCQLTAAAGFASSSGTLITLMTISINRYIKVCQIRLYERIFTYRKTVAICVAIWLSAVMAASLPLMSLGRYTFDRKALMCTIDRTFSLPFNVLAISSWVLVPGFISAFCYTRIFVYIRESQRRVNDDSNAAKNHRVDNNLTKTLFVITIMYFIFLSPVCFVFIVDHWDTLPTWPLMYTMGFAYLKSAIDPIVFGVTNKSFRRNYVDVLGLRRCRVAADSELITANEATTYAPSITPQSNNNDDEHATLTVSF